MTIVDDFWSWVTSILDSNRALNDATQRLRKTTNQTELDTAWNELPADIQQSGGPKLEYDIQKKIFSLANSDQDAFEMLLSGALDSWLNTIQRYQTNDPQQARENLVKLSADAMELAASSALIDMGLGLIPTANAGSASSANTKQLLTWLGVGGVITAVAHDPVKIGLFRPYQDLLEMTFRNRRPGDGDLFACYQQRSLSSTKVEDVSLITEQLMNQIDAENDAYYDTEIAKWGYSPFFSGALKDAATKTLSFGSLMALAKQGRLDRGMATFSLWGYGLDRRLMDICLDALDQTNEVANYTGFRAQIEPAYVDGSIDEAALLDFWAKLHIPQDVQDIMLPRFRSQREAHAEKDKESAAGVQKDLTVSQIQNAYQNQLYDRGTAQNAMLSLGYDMEEVKILLDLAEMRRKLPSAQNLKRLPLSDYEKAEKNGLISKTDVLDRMAGEYTPEDIELERKLLNAGKA